MKRRNIVSKTDCCNQHNTKREPRIQKVILKKPDQHNKEKNHTATANDWMRMRAPFVRFVDDVEAISNSEVCQLSNDQRQRNESPAHQRVTFHRMNELFFPVLP